MQKCLRPNDVGRERPCTAVDLRQLPWPALTPTASPSQTLLKIPVRTMLRLGSRQVVGGWLLALVVGSCKSVAGGSRAVPHARRGSVDMSLYVVDSVKKCASLSVGTSAFVVKIHEQISLAEYSLIAWNE